MKRCTTCQELKYENEFAKRSESNDGLQAKCRDCKRAYQKENKEHIKEYQKNYKKENREYQINYQKENRKYITEYQNEWHKKDITWTLILE